jgi:NAD(P)-dependent dehydrogenase (short-subunit alcohol dehydrogenase family)
MANPNHPEKRAEKLTEKWAGKLSARMGKLKEKDFTEQEYSGPAASRPRLFLTGAASGIGRQTALLFASRGWQVGAVDLDEVGLQALRGEARGPMPIWIARADVTDPASLKAALDRFVLESGREGLEVIFNCAGILKMGTYEQVGRRDHDLQIDVNVRGVLHGVDAALPHLRCATEFAGDSEVEGVKARIITMASASALAGVPLMAVYSATKFFVRGLTEALHVELRGEGIVVSDLSVPFVRTPMIVAADVQAPSIGKFGIHVEPQDVAEVVWAAAHGDQIHYDVGWMMQAMRVADWALPFQKARAWMMKKTSL